MKRRFFLALSTLCLLAAAGLTFNAWQGYRAAQRLLPPGTRIAGLPVSGLDAQAASLRLTQVYDQLPVELRYAGQVINMPPAQAGFALDLDAMLSEALAGTPWTFGDYLFHHSRAQPDVPLRASLNAQRLDDYLRQQIAPRLERAPSAARPSAAGDLTMRPGQPGLLLDVTAAKAAITAALFSPDQRVVTLHVEPVEALPPQFDDLGPMLEAVLQASGYPGTIEIALQDIVSGQSVQLAYQQGLRVPPGIAFTGASTIKIPVMVAAFRRVEGDLPPALRQKMSEMIDLSDNNSTDEVMQMAISPVDAPLQVTRDMRALGLQDTFLAGFFYTGAALLDRFETPANTRSDVNTDPDLYNQTSPGDIVWLLAAIETCAADNSGPLIDTFNGQVTQVECQVMIDLLRANRKGLLIEAGLPEGTPLAHKYGWVTDFNDGLLHNASDAGIVYSPAGRFALSIFLYDPDQLQWDAAQNLVARLARAAYNFYNEVP